VAEVLLPEIGKTVTNNVRFAMVGVEDSFGESGDPEKLKEKYGLTAENITNKIFKLLQ
jgi:transketolase C-terminal domain/subunit